MSPRIKPREGVPDWWFGTMEFYDFPYFPFSWECHHPNWLSLTHSIIFQRGGEKPPSSFWWFSHLSMIFPAIKLHFSPPTRYKKKSCRIPWYVIPQKLHLPSKSCHGSLDGSGVWPMWLGRHWAVRSCDSMMESWCFILEMVMVIRMIQSGVVGPNTSAKSCVLLRTGTTGTWGHAMAEDWTQTFKKRSLLIVSYIISKRSSDSSRFFGWF